MNKNMLILHKKLTIKNSLEAYKFGIKTVTLFDILQNKFHTT